jgi:hypothetical protein
MRLIELEVGTWFRSPSWTLNAVAQLVEEPRAEHGLACIQVHRRLDADLPAEHTATRARLATVKEMDFAEWYACERPSWISEVGGSGGGWDAR